uniref:Eco57I restriction-modification methylase domain-containing protein n=1 Tax=Thioalkalivibrio sp. HK1 TaxID=1469245 RepID=UPI0006889FDA
MDKTLQSFAALRIVGGILSPEFLHKIARLDAPDQKAADYDLSRSLDIKQEIDRYWLIARDLHTQYKERRVREGLDKEQITEQWNRNLLQDVLGYKTLTEFDDTNIEERTFPLTHQAHEGAVPLLLVKDFELELDRADKRFGNEHRNRQAPHNLMQEYLNATDRSLWGAVSNGSKFRLLRDNASLTRPAYIEIDLELIFEEDLTPDFAAFWLMAHDSRLRPTKESGKNNRCIIEGWRDQSHEIGERVRADLRKGVTDALRSLGQGFLQHSDNEALRKRLRPESLEEPAHETMIEAAQPNLSERHYFEQILRLVYRLLFLFAAEERALLHPPNTPKEKRAIYEQGYGIARLRDLARRRRNYDHHHDLWQSLRITFRALGEGIDDLGLPALGGLFRYEKNADLAPDSKASDSDTFCPDLDNARITNEYLLEAIHKLAFFATKNSLVRINYRDMGTEELGSVYESLLELHPQVEVNSLPWRFSFINDSDDEGKTTRGSDRKLTGSYYTPPTLVAELIKSTLEPVIQRTIEENPKDPRTALLQLKIIDPACGSGHFLLEAARRLAIEIARLESEDNTVDENLRRSALREVVQHCIYGVDRNPLAVDLCKVALWMEAVVPDKPLTFLDSHILEGDSLIGVFDKDVLDEPIPDDAYKASTGDDKAVCADLKRRNRLSKQRDLLYASGTSDPIAKMGSLEEMPEDTSKDIEEKRRLRKAQLKEQEPEKLRADLYVAAWFAKKTKDNPDSVPLTQDLHRLEEDERSRRVEAERLASTLAKENRFFHWHLAFGHILDDGGFDVILGNPPWKRIKLQEKKFFDGRSSKITNARNSTERKRLIEALNEDDARPADRRLYQEFILAKRHAESASLYCLSSNRFPLTGKGDINTYAPFSELLLQALSPKGRSGMIVPTGIAVDDTTKVFFRHIIEKKRLVSLFDFENHDKLFPAVSSKMKFCLMTLSGENLPISDSEFAFYLHRTDQLKDDEKRFSLTEDDFELFNPNTKNAPTFRTRKDMELARKIYRNAGGVLLKEGKGSIPDRNPWGVKLSTMFHMSNDSKFFKTRKDMENEGYQLQGNHFIKDDECWLPLYEAKLFFQYDHRFATFDVSEDNIKSGHPRQTTIQEKEDPKSVILPRYWVDLREVEKRLEKTEKIPKNPSVESAIIEQRSIYQNERTNER